MWVYEKKLEYPVCIKSKDLKMAQLWWTVGRVICFSAIFDPALHDADRADQGSFNRYWHRRISTKVIDITHIIQEDAYIA